VRPLIYHQPSKEDTEERIVIQFARRPFTGFGKIPRPADIPPITAVQAEAMDALHYAAEKLCVAFDLEKGDIQYINNLCIFHARNGFTDTPDCQWVIPNMSSPSLLICIVGGIFSGYGFVTQSIVGTHLKL
jgi:hypothetical protein